MWYPNYKKNNIVQHKSRCSARTLYCTQNPNFFTNSQDDLKHHIAKKHSAAKSVVTFKCKLCYQEFLRFSALRQHKNTQNGFPFKTTIVDPDKIINAVDDANLKKDLRSYQHFLVDCELERMRHKIFNYDIENFNAQSGVKKFDHFFRNLNCEAK